MHPASTLCETAAALVSLVASHQVVKALVGFPPCESLITMKPGVVALVVEDETLVRMEAADVLEDAGFDVLEASTTQAALAYLEQHPEIALLFTDVVLPGPIDGLALAHKVRCRWPRVKIIIASSRVTPHPAELPEGARFLEKPYYSNRLARMVREMGFRPRN